MTTDPASALVWPKVDERLETANNITGFTSYISPSYWLGELAGWLLGQNPWEEASRMIAGDWKMVSESGSAIEHLAEFNSLFSAALNQQSGMLFGEQMWTGRAATDAAAYFRQLELTLGEQAGSLKDIAYEVQKLTLGVNQAADRIKGLLEDLTDELITLGVGGYVKVGVRFVTGGAKAAASVKRAGDLWREIVKTYNEALNLVKTGTALAMEGWTSMPKDFKTISSKGYDHVGVSPPKPKPSVRPSAPAQTGGPTGLLGAYE